MHASIDTVAHGHQVVVRVGGVLDVRTARALREELVALVDGGHDDLVVDLTGVSCVDSTGLGVLLGARARLQRTGGRLQVVVEDEGLVRTLRVSALTRVLVVRGSLDAALSGAVQDHGPPPRTGAGS